MLFIQTTKMKNSELHRKLNRMVVVVNKNYSEHTEIDSGHGRTCQQMLSDTSWLSKEYRWSGLTSIIKIKSETHNKSTGKH